jgi:hypothetical protein
MSRSFPITPVRVLAASAVLLAVALTPASAQAPVTPERALLNTVPAGSSGLVARFSTFERTPSRPVDGERALLARVEEPVFTAEDSNSDSAPIDGARALLGRWAPAETPRTALSAEWE